MYNTVLGAKPLQPDGRAFYYADYNFAGRKVYSIIAFHAARARCRKSRPITASMPTSAIRSGVYVNLYLPSSVRWTMDGAQIELTQRSNYPFEGQVQIEVKTSRPAEFAVSLRIPAWAEEASLAVNGKLTDATAGVFASVAGMEERRSNRARATDERRGWRRSTRSIRM